MEETRSKVTMYAEVRDPQTLCGIGKCKPRCLQRFANMTAFSLSVAVAGLFSSTISVYLPSQITTLEKYFGFSSAQSGFILSCNDIGFLVTTLFFSHFARKVHVPRTLAAATFFFGFSGLICTLAYFFSPTFLSEDKGLKLTDKQANLAKNVSAVATNFLSGQLCGNETDKCVLEMNKIKIGAPTQFTKYALLIFAVGMILQGFCKAPRSPFSTTYIDDNVDKSKTALYLGIIMGLAIFGPAIAFGLGGFFTKIFITLEDVYITPTDPRWVGAWWLGFLFFGSLAIVSAVPLLFFPRRMKPKLRTEKTKRKFHITKEIKEYFRGLIKVVTNKILMLCVLSSCVNLFVVGSALAFMPKYLETQFQIPTWKANIIMVNILEQNIFTVFGELLNRRPRISRAIYIYPEIASVMGILTSSLGSFLGGLIVSRRKLSPPACAKFVVCVSIISLVVPTAGLFLGCPAPPMIGRYKTVNSHETNKTVDSLGVSGCSSACQCDPEDYFPVCGEDGQNYFSPCHAGCTVYENHLYTQCLCLGIHGNGTATPGLCKRSCDQFYPYIVLMAVGSFITTLGILPTVIFSIRCVSEKEKALAVGVSSFLQTLLGWFPGPIVMGKIIDSSCLYWSQSCQGKGACTMYDADDFRLKRHVVEIIAKIIVIIMQLAMLYMALRKKWPAHETNSEPLPETELFVNGKENTTSQNAWESSSPIYKHRLNNK